MKRRENCPISTDLAGRRARNKLVGREARLCELKLNLRKFLSRIADRTRKVKQSRRVRTYVWREQSRFRFRSDRQNPGPICARTSARNGRDSAGNS